MDRSGVVGYRESNGLALAMDDDADLRLERPLIEAVQLAICAWAENEPETFLAFAKSNDHCALMFVQRLLSQGLARCASRFPGHALTFLCADPRRLVLGSFANIYQDSFNLIQAVAQHLEEAEFDQLKLTIMGWSHYLVDADDDAQLRRKRAQWDRQSRLRLLRALPKERMSPADRKHLDEEERAFPHLCSKEVTFTGVHCIGSPVSTEQMQKSQDEDILNLFNELTDEHGCDHPRELMKGGAIQAGRELARLAKTDPLRAVNLILQLLPGKNEIPVSEVLRELIKAGYLASDLFNLIVQLDGRGFSSQSFRHAAAYAICDAVSCEEPAIQIPDVLMTLLEGWLVSTADASETSLIAEESSDIGGSLLWGHHQMVMYPSGNFPVLSALSQACLSCKPKKMDAWLGILERHLSRRETPSVWAAMCWRYLLYLEQADQIRAQGFLKNMFVAFPSLLSTKEIMIFVARLQGWIGPDNAKRWLDSMSKTGKVGQQGFGEVLMLRSAMFPNEPWPRATVETLLAASAEVAEEQVGVAHAIANLWSESAYRAIAHGYLLTLLASSDKRILDALGSLFLKQTMLPDTKTRELLTALCRYPGLLRDQRAEHLTEHLESLVAVMPEQVIGVSNALLDQVGESMGNMATSWYLSSEPLLAVALALQDMGDPYRAAGVALFERMLEFNLPQAQEMTISLDKRTLSQSIVSAPRIRRRRKVKPVK